MLTPEFIAMISEGAEDIASELHGEIMRRVIERIMIRLGRGDDYLLTPIDKWQLEVLGDAGFLMESIQRDIAKATKLQMKEIKEAFEYAGIKSLEYDDALYRAAGMSPVPLMESPHLIRLLERGYNATEREWRNYTRTTAESYQRLYIRECDRAYNLASSGSISARQAVVEAIDRILGDTPQREKAGVVYPSGHIDTIEVATTRAVRTGISQATADITDARMEEMGWDIILVSSHLGARVTDKNDFTNHYWWQGKFYSKSGNDKRFTPFSVCGRGHVQGINGANCSHSYGPGDGIHNPFRGYDSEENKEAYEIRQRQRALERRIRSTKNEVKGYREAIDNASNPDVKSKLDEKYKHKAVLLEKQNKAYNDFCEENNLKRRADRLKIAKWNRAEAMRASGAARRYKNRSKNNNIMRVEKTSLTGEPNSITEKINKNGGIDRNYYDDTGKQIKQISNNNHGNAKLHPYGTNGEHAHDYEYNERGELTGRPIRELTLEEREENNDIL